MDIKQLQYFLALARQEHMSLTAEFLDISQPALSKSIRNLEKELGVDLFDRHGNHIKLNRNGQEFSDTAARILVELERGKRSLHQSRYDFRGTVRITCHAFADAIMPCVLDYMALNPQVRVCLYQSQQGDEKIKDKIEFLLSGHGGGDLEREWVSQPLFSEEAYIMISPRYREYPPEINALSPADLKNDLFVGDFVVSELFTFVDLVHRVCRSAGFEPKMVFLTDDFISKIQIVHEGRAITILPYSCLNIVRKLSPDIQAFRIEHFDSRRTVYLMRKKESQLSEVALDFWDFAGDYYRDRQS